MVRELEGWTINPGAGPAAPSGPPGLTIWVADEALNGKEVRVWRSQEISGGWVRKTKRMRHEAAALAAELNAAEAEDMAA